MIQQGMDSPARAVAAARGIPVIELVPAATPAGDFTLHPPPPLAGAPAQAGRGAGRRHRAGAAHLRHHLAAEDRAAEPASTSPPRPTISPTTWR